MEKFPDTIKKVGKSYVLSDVQLDWYDRTFPNYKTSDIAFAMGVSTRYAEALANKRGLKKSERYLHKIHVAKGKACVKAQRASGYLYKGRGFPEEALQKLREKRASGWNPQRSFREKHPKMYKNHCVRRGQLLHEAIENDRRRIQIGLAQKTNRNVPAEPYSRKQVHYRYSAFQRGYILGSTEEERGERFTLYYDEDTERSEKFEEGARLKGFSIKPLSGSNVFVYETKMVNFE